MFGVIISGRPVITEAATVSPTQFAFTIPAAPSFSHIVVFLLPGTTLPPDTAAAVYIQIPTSPDFKLLGAIANEKQSAIFKINSKAIGIDGFGASDDAMTDEPVSSAATGNVTLGISVEPAAQVATALANLKMTQAQENTALALKAGSSGQSQVSTKILAQRIIANAYNFLASFAGNGPAGNEVVPLKSFQEWWKKFEKRIELDPGFLERGDAS